MDLSDFHGAYQKLIVTPGNNQSIDLANLVTRFGYAFLEAHKGGSALGEDVSAAFGIVAQAYHAIEGKFDQMLAKVSVDSIADCCKREGFLEDEPEFGYVSNNLPREIEQHLARYETTREQSDLDSGLALFFYSTIMYRHIIRTYFHKEDLFAEYRNEPELFLDWIAVSTHALDLIDDKHRKNGIAQERKQFAKDFFRYHFVTSYDVQEFLDDDEGSNDGEIEIFPPSGTPPQGTLVLIR